MTAIADELDRLCERVAETPPGRRLLPVAGQTKPALSRSDRDDVETLDLSSLRGVLEYDPAELTITALAGTPISELAAVLAEHGQHLPFDPPLGEAGATLGGVVAAATSGSGALRHGGVRDFVIGVRLIDGTGRLVAGGGRVVKNAAGFDLPKLMVGSRGRLGVIVQLSLKVFPVPRATVTLRFACGQTTAAVALARHLAGGPRELDAADIDDAGELLIRLGGDPAALPDRVRRLTEAAGAVAELVEGEADVQLWRASAAMRWVAPQATLVRVPLTAAQAAPLMATVVAAGGAGRVVRAGNLAWVAWPAGAPVSDLDAYLRRAGLTGIVLIGAADDPILGRREPVGGGAFGARVRAALDPHDRFLALEEPRRAA